MALTAGGLLAESAGAVQRSRLASLPRGQHRQTCKWQWVFCKVNAVATFTRMQCHPDTPSPTPATHPAAGPLSTAERAKGAIVACLTCDAAATGVQWIYDLDTLAQLQQQRQQQVGADMQTRCSLC